MRVRVVVERARDLGGLMQALADARCLVRQVDESSCRVRLLDSCPPEQALVELRFFVAAWACVVPGRTASVAPAARPQPAR
jgi:hypothetical protein